MTAHVTAFAATDPISISRAEDVARTRHFDAPTLVLDVTAVRQAFRALAAGLVGARIHYAVKANPHPAVLQALREEGSNFDAASRAEIADCLAAGAAPHQISFGNTVKKPADIAWAHEQGITLFAADAPEEIEKIAQNAPGARVYIRLLVTNSSADWPLSRKFGCSPAQVPGLVDLATDLGLRPVGLSFHVGSQTRQAAMWAPVLDDVAQVWHSELARGTKFTLLNVGGGFPAYYGQHIDAPTAYGAAVMKLLEARFGKDITVMAEPGRGLVAEAGAIAAEVLLVSRKHDDDLHRWVYLDIGKFSGLAETMDEAIRYRFMTPRDGTLTGSCVLAGPSCDSADVLYEKRPVELPLSLQAGDRIVIRTCGAYTTSYASVGFNGFPPLDVLVI